MDTVLGLLGIIVWMVAVVAIAAAVTYAVVRISPGDKPASTPTHPPA